MDQTTAPPELLYNLRLWLHTLNVPADEIPDERLAGLIKWLDCHRDVFEYSMDGTHIEYAPLPDTYATVTLTDGTTVEWVLCSDEQAWRLRNWHTPDAVRLLDMLGGKAEPAEQTCPLRLPPGTTVDNLRIAPGIDWYGCAVASPYVALDGSPVPGQAVPPSEGYGTRLVPSDQLAVTERGMAYWKPPEPTPCPDCRGTGEYRGTGERRDVSDVRRDGDDVNRCKDCRWWAPNTKGFRKDRGAYACKNPALHRTVSDLQFDHPDGACGDEELGQPFLTGPEFGCVHHEPRSTT